MLYCLLSLVLIHLFTCASLLSGALGVGVCVCAVHAKCISAQQRESWLPLAKKLMTLLALGGRGRDGEFPHHLAEYLRQKTKVKL